MPEEISKERISGQFSSHTCDKVRAEAKKENRSFNQMMEILLNEALAARTPVTEY